MDFDVIGAAVVCKTSILSSAGGYASRKSLQNLRDICFNSRFSQLFYNLAFSLNPCFISTLSSPTSMNGQEPLSSAILSVVGFLKMRLQLEINKRQTDAG